MNILQAANWIKPSKDFEEVCPYFKKNFKLNKQVKNATLTISALGVYEAVMNQSRIGEFFMAPGWTTYNKRIQVQTYDITSQIKSENELIISAGKGWCIGNLAWKNKSNIWNDTISIIAEINIIYIDDTKESIVTDNSWQVGDGPVRYSEIYHGEVYDAQVAPNNFENVVIYDHTKDVLIPQQGEIIKEFENIKPISLITTPMGEKVIDFGQNMTGYLRFNIKGKAGDIAEISHAEVLDKDGNFYTENLRSAKQKIQYICGGKQESYQPHFSFQGFRFIRLDKWPTDIDLNDFTAIVVHSDMKRTGYFECSNPLLNKLFSNVIWGQKGNYLDVPTDCPQRDERLGWTGDAQAFVRAGSYNFNVNKFFTKWLADVKADQYDNGGISHVIPNALGREGSSAAWGDAAVICPWQIYLTYGDEKILADQFDSMKKWIEYIRHEGENEFLWNTGAHFGDWLGLDSPEGSCKGSTSEYLIATAFYAYSTSLLIKSGKVLGIDMAEYEVLYKNIVAAFKSEYIKDGKMTSDTQTAHVLALYFNLADNKKTIAARLAELVKENGNKLTTGFVGTPYLLHVLSENGYEDLAYTLMLQEEFPSWLFSVKMGATTIWEHWDGIKPDGSMWSADMNSFNHYAYGAIADWMYGVMAGINTDDTQPGFQHIIFKPISNKRLDYVRASIETKFGTLSSDWKHQGDTTVFNFVVPKGATATIILGNVTYEVKDGNHQYII